MSCDPGGLCDVHGLPDCCGKTPSGPSLPPRPRLVGSTPDDGCGRSRPARRGSAKSNLPLSGIAPLPRPSRSALRWLAVFYALTALMFGMAHRMQSDAATTGDITALLMRGELLPAGCGGAPDEPGPSALAELHCDACLLAQGAAPPPPGVVLSAPPQAPLAQTLYVDLLSAIAGPRRSRPPCRAPPAPA